MDIRLFRTAAALACAIAACSLMAAGCSSESAAARQADPGVAAGPASTQPLAGRFSLTVYSTADPATFSPQDLLQDQLTRGGYDGGSPSVVFTPGFGVVREIRPMRMAAGTNRLEFSDVAAGIDPTTVAFQSLTAPQTTTVLEQNFDYDLASSQQLLQKYIGRDVTMTVSAAPSTPWSPPRPGAQTSIMKGTLLSTSGGSYVIRTGEPVKGLTLVSMQNVVSVGLADSTLGFVVKPTLNWKVEAKLPGEHQVQVTYQTDGLTWRADYSLLISPDEKTADLSAWVTMVNGSGMSYPDARLKLVAGSVQRFESPSRLQRYQQVTNQLFSSGQGGGGGQGGFEEKSFFEYHLYTLGRATSLNNNSTKQIELFPPRRQVPLEKAYVYNGLNATQREFLYHNPNAVDDAFGVVGNKSVDIYVRIKNSEANHLGIPLPAGRLRTYKIDPADDSREFIGEDVVQHTPKDESILARLGTAFELVGERKQTSFERNGQTATESFEITLRNHKDTAATVIIRELLYRGLNWEILKTSDKWDRVDYRTIHFPIEVPANGEKKVTYTVKYSW